MDKEIVVWRSNGGYGWSVGRNLYRRISGVTLKEPYYVDLTLTTLSPLSYEDRWATTGREVLVTWSGVRMLSSLNPFIVLRTNDRVEDVK